MTPEEFKNLAASSGGYGLAAIFAFVAGYIYRQLEAARRELVEMIKADGADQRALLMQTVPLSTKLGEGVVIVGKAVDTLERVADKIRSTTRE